MKQEQNFTQGAILPTLLRFALPVLLALLLQAMYGAVDLQVVGKFGTAADISAVSTGSQVMHTVTVVITGLAMGVTVLLGQKIGEGRPDEAGRAVGCGICLFAAVALAVTAVMLLAAPRMSVLMQAPADAFADTVVYVKAQRMSLFDADHTAGFFLQRSVDGSDELLCLTGTFRPHHNCNHRAFLLFVLWLSSLLFYQVFSRKTTGIFVKVL